MVIETAASCHFERSHGYRSEHDTPSFPQGWLLSDTESTLVAGFRGTTIYRQNYVTNVVLLGVFMEFLDGKDVPSSSVGEQALGESS